MSNKWHFFLDIGIFLILRHGLSRTELAWAFNPFLGTLFTFLFSYLLVLMGNILLLDTRVGGVIGLTLPSGVA